MKSIFTAADILLPKYIDNPEFATKWAVVACDQFTAEPEYWQRVEDIVRDCPSTFRAILPEVYLGEKDSRLGKIAENMKLYKNDILSLYRDSMVLVRRKIGNGKIRLGIVGKIDLEEYDYSIGSTSAIRATEGTVLERIPPRVEVRRGAVIEMPHVMLLIDDANKSVIEKLDTVSMKKIYDFELMLGGGHIEGYLLSKEQIDFVEQSIAKLFENNGSTIKFAVGDGNHSLASAKARYEELKEKIGDRAKEHPLRYALCEVVNLHDSALEFEPIYRIAITENKEVFLLKLRAYAKKCGEGNQKVECIYDGKTETVNLGKGTHMLTVGTLQNFLDEQDDTEVDYIHGLDSIKKLSQKHNAVGFVFDGMEKIELFEAVEKHGALPRKTFSMGEAIEKRYYIECRDITE